MMNPGMKRTLIAGVALIAITSGIACRNRDVAAAPPPGLAAQSPNVPQDFRPYIALKSLPPPPAQHTSYGKNLTLCKCSEGYCLQDSRHRMYPAGRDSQGHIVPVYRHANRTIPLRYDTYRDRYYYVGRDNYDRCYRHYEDDPDDVFYYDDVVYPADYVYDPYYEPVVHVPRTYYSRSHHDDWLLAIPLVLAALLFLRPRHYAYIEPPIFITRPAYVSYWYDPIYYSGYDIVPTTRLYTIPSGYMLVAAGSGYPDWGSRYVLCPRGRLDAVTWVERSDPEFRRLRVQPGAVFVPSTLATRSQVLRPRDVWERSYAHRTYAQPQVAGLTGRAPPPYPGTTYRSGERRPLESFQPSQRVAESRMREGLAHRTLQQSPSATTQTPQHAAAQRTFEGAPRVASHAQATQTTHGTFHDSPRVASHRHEVRTSHRTASAATHGREQRVAHRTVHESHRVSGGHSERRPYGREHAVSHSPRSYSHRSERTVHSSVRHERSTPSWHQTERSHGYSSVRHESQRSHGDWSGERPRHSDRAPSSHERSQPERSHERSNRERGHGGGGQAWLQESPRYEGRTAWQSGRSERASSWRSESARVERPASWQSEARSYRSERAAAPRQEWQASRGNSSYERRASDSRSESRRSERQRGESGGWNHG